MTYRFHPSARRELTEAVAYYDRISRRLGDDFVDEVENAINRILSFPEAWPTLSAETRRCRMKRFPYGLVYQIRGDEVVIVAVMHLHRKPNCWEDRL